jgi:CRP/FNR family cyclic AMP-dependent transcriptional regulator
MAFPTAAPMQSLEEVLGRLTGATRCLYAKGHVLYELGDPAMSLFYLVDGLVKVSRQVRKHRHVVIEIYVPGELFGESALLGGNRSEQAVVMECATVRACPASEIQSVIGENPHVGIALLQNLVARSGHFVDRMETLSADKVQERLARVLLRSAERFGTRLTDGNVQLPQLTHEVLSGWVGTSRELVTHYMTQFRREGLIQYSRREIFIREVSLTAWLNAAVSSSED